MDFRNIDKSPIKGLRVGDTVKIKSYGKIFSTYPSWFVDNDIEYLMGDYVRTRTADYEDIEEWVVAFIAPHKDYDRYGMICAIKNDNYVMLIMQSGLEKINTYNVDLI